VTAIKNNLFDRYKLTVSEETIKDDIVGFVNIGLNIEISDRGFIFKDTIKDFIIPELTIDEVTTSDIFNYKEDCRTRLTHIPHSYLSLIDLAFDSQQNRLFEMQTIQLFVDECGFSGRHLGGGRKPDGVIYRTEEQHGIIIDTKAYSGGYSLPINQADEMTRYVRENIGRSTEINPNAWWNNFPESIKYFNFAFISSLFKGNFVHQLNRIALDTNVNGAALNVINMLLLAEKIKSNSISYDEVYEKFASNNEIICS
jgi:hypothetical protein